MVVMYVLIDNTLMIVSGILSVNLQRQIEGKTIEMMILMILKKKKAFLLLSKTLLSSSLSIILLLTVLGCLNAPTFN